MELLFEWLDPRMSKECVVSNIKPLGLPSIQAGKGGATPANQRLWKNIPTTLQVDCDNFSYLADFLSFSEVVVTPLAFRKFLVMFLIWCYSFFLKTNSFGK